MTILRQWYEYVNRKDVTDGISRVLDIDIVDVVGNGRPKWRQGMEKYVLR